MKYIDIHTHTINGSENIQILNVFAQALPEADLANLYSAGLHPWHIEMINQDKCFRAIERSAGLRNMKAVGECGLDRSIMTDFALQKKCFKKQIEISEQHSKPLIIHCVRAYYDLIRLKNETKSELPWIIHGYFGNKTITQALINHGFWFSVGESMLNEIPKHEILKIIPPERLFLETDDRDISIEKIYSVAAVILKIDEEQLAEAIYNNFIRLFGNEK